MASKLSLLTALPFLFSLGSCQKPGQSLEVHPKLTTARCTLKDGCKPATNYIVLDALAHPIHQATNSFDCGGWGSAANATACPDLASCRDNCIMEGIPDYAKVGVTTSGSDLKLQMFNADNQFISPRVYLLDDTERSYEMLKLTGYEFTFEVDATKLPCGMNSALYLSEMEAKGGQSDINPGGAYYGTGYCDAQCFVTPFINGVGNLDAKGACCNEMDIWEANSHASHVAPHPCSKPGLYLCEGAECGKEAPGVCDKSGCAWQPYRVNNTDYYGNGPEFKVDTTKKPITVITQFPADAATGKMTSIHRMYIQDGKLIKAYTVDAPGLPKVDSLTDELCSATNSKRYMDLGATAGMGEALTRGMVLAMSIWWDEGGNMNWLDSGEAGPCSKDEGHPSVIVTREKNPEVTYSNIRWGEIGSTFKGKSGECKGKGKGKGPGKGKRRV